MLTHEIDDALFKLGQVYEVHGKKIPQGACNFWRDFFAGFEFEEVSHAINRLARTCKHAPKPNDIEEFIKANKPRAESEKYIYRGCCPLTKQALEDDQRRKDEAEEKIKDAWLTYRNVAWNRKKDLDGNPKPLTPEQYHAIEIVNREAAKRGMRTAIADEYIIETIWEQYA